MAITASGIYFLTMEKALIDTLGVSLESTANKFMLTDDTETPNFDTDAFRSNVTEVTGTNWPSGGVAITAPAITVSAGTLIYGASNVSVASTTLVAVMASVLTTGNATVGSDPIWMLHDFVTAVNTSAGTFGINWTGGQLATLDLTP